jgi:cation:H+ antiporter
VSGVASFRGNGGLAIGNVLGSNVANIGLILGISAIILPLMAERAIVRRDLPVMIAAAAVFPMLGLDGVISRLDGGLLLFLFCAYLAYLARAARSESLRSTSLTALSVIGDASRPEPKSRAWLRVLGVALAGLILLVIGANVMVGAAVNLATNLGVPDEVIGLTLVAVGTSLPELAASISAARRGDGQIIIGNIIGSNIFNVLLIVGVAALVYPLPVSTTVLRLDAPIVLALSVGLMVIVLVRGRVGRKAGAGLLATYAGFIMLTAL